MAELTLSQTHSRSPEAVAFTTVDSEERQSTALRRQDNQNNWILRWQGWRRKSRDNQKNQIKDKQRERTDTQLLENERQTAEPENIPISSTPRSREQPQPLMSPKRKEYMERLHRENSEDCECRARIPIL